MLRRTSSCFLRRSQARGLRTAAPEAPCLSRARVGLKDLQYPKMVPATAPATKLHKDTSGDVGTAVTFTAAVPTDATGTTSAAQPLVQLTQVEWQAFLARVTVLEELLAQLTEVQSQLKAAEASFSKNSRSRLRAALLGRMQSRTVVSRETMPWTPLWRCSVSASGPDTWWYTGSQTRQLSATQLLWSVLSNTGLTVLGPTGGHHPFLNLSQLSQALAGQELGSACGVCQQSGKAQDIRIVQAAQTARNFPD